MCIRVISATKYIMKKESTRDHLDLLLSSKHWPVVYAVDMACDIAAHAEVHNQLLANVLWGDRRGCLTDYTPIRMRARGPRVAKLFECRRPPVKPRD